MKQRTSTSQTTAARPVAVVPVAVRVKLALERLREESSARVREGLGRYGLPSERALGVPINRIQAVAKELGCDHALADPLWATGIYEARLLVAYVGDPAAITSVQLDRWCREFDNWGVVDTLCFVLIDRSPLAWRKVEPWAAKSGEFQKRAGFVLLACLAAHDAEAEDARFLRLLPLVEREAADERNFVKKGISWALRMIGRRNRVLCDAAVVVARRLAAADKPAARWIGKGALKELTGPVVTRRLAALAKKARSGG